MGDAEGLLRDLAPQALGVLARRTSDFGAAQDAVQEALLAAATQWPRDGLPENPRGWLVTVAGRRLVEQWRRDAARRNREGFLVAHAGSEVGLHGGEAVDGPGVPEGDSARSATPRARRT